MPHSAELPADSRALPPAPLVPSPTPTLTSPPMPAADDPDVIDTPPELPDVLLPLAKRTSPLTPAPALSAEPTVTLPLLLLLLPPPAARELLLCLPTGWQ